MRQEETLARRDPRHLREAWNNPSWQRIWLAIQAKEWRSLAIVPGSRGVSTLELAQVLVDVGWQHRGLPIGLADLRNITLPYIDSVIEEVQKHVYNGERVLIALRSVFENPASVPIAQWADGALLCVSLGNTRIRGAEQTLEQVGKDRFLGSVIVRHGASSELAVRS
jgi:hypothetical protein